jgi:hypothetical protein
MAHWGHSWPILLANIILVIISRRTGCVGLWQVWGRGGGILWFVVGNLRKEQLESPRYRWENNVQWICEEMACVLAGMIFLWMQTCVRLLWKPQWIIGLYEMCGIAWLTDVLFVCQEGFCYMGLVIVLSKLTDVLRD